MILSKRKPGTVQTHHPYMIKHKQQRLANSYHGTISYPDLTC